LPAEYSGGLTLSHKFDMVLHYENKAKVFIFKPEFSQLCYNEVLTNALVAKFMLVGNTIGDNTITDVDVTIVTLTSDKPLYANVDVTLMEDEIRETIANHMYNRLVCNHARFYELYSICCGNEGLHSRFELLDDMVKGNYDGSNRIPKYILDHMKSLRILPLSIVDMITRDTFIDQLNQLLRLEIDAVLISTTIC
jgi:hypothetical protein